MNEKLYNKATKADFSKILVNKGYANNIKIILTLSKIGIAFTDEYFAEISFSCFII